MQFLMYLDISLTFLQKWVLMNGPESELCYTFPCRDSAEINKRNRAGVLGLKFGYGHCSMIY